MLVDRRIVTAARWCRYCRVAAPSGDGCDKYYNRALPTSGTRRVEAEPSRVEWTVRLSSVARKSRRWWTCARYSPLSRYSLCDFGKSHDCLPRDSSFYENVVWLWTSATSSEVARECGRMGSHTQRSERCRWTHCARNVGTICRNGGRRATDRRGLLISSLRRVYMSLT